MKEGLKKYIWCVIRAMEMKCSSSGRKVVVVEVGPENVAAVVVISASKALLFFCDNLEPEKQWAKAVEALREMDHMQKAQTWTLMVNKATTTALGSHNNNNDAASLLLLLSKYKCAYKRAVREAEEEESGRGGGGCSCCYGGYSSSPLKLTEIDEALNKSIELCRLFQKTYSELIDGRLLMREITEVGGRGGGVVDGVSVLKAEVDENMKQQQSLKSRMNYIEKAVIENCIPAIKSVDDVLLRVSTTSTDHGRRMELLDIECKKRGENNESRFGTLDTVNKSTSLIIDRLDRECKTRGENNALKFRELEEGNTHMTSRMDQLDSECKKNQENNALKFSELEEGNRKLEEGNTHMTGRMDQLDSECVARDGGTATKISDLDKANARTEGRLAVLESRGGDRNSSSGSSSSETTTTTNGGAALSGIQKTASGLAAAGLANGGGRSHVPLFGSEEARVSHMARMERAKQMRGGAGGGAASSQTSSTTKKFSSNMELAAAAEEEEDQSSSSTAAAAQQQQQQ